MLSETCFAGPAAILFSPDGLITSVSCSLEKFPDGSAGELIGKPIIRLMADETAFQMPSMMAAAVREGCWKGAIACRTCGAPAKVQAVLLPLVHSSGSATGFVLIVRREASDEKLPVSEIAGALRNLAHEMSNPLTILSGYTQLLMGNPACSEKIRADVGKLYFETCRLVAAVEKLRALSLSLHEPGRGTEAPAPATAGSVDSADQ